MEKMTILEYLAFGEASKEMKEMLKKVYFNVAGGREAQIVETKDGGVLCTIDQVQKINRMDPWSPVKIHRVTLIIKRDGSVLSTKEENITQESDRPKTQLI